MKNSTVSVYICLIIIICSCNPQGEKGFSDAGLGLEYKFLFMGNDERKVQENDLLELESKWFSGKDQLPADSIYLNENGNDTITYHRATDCLLMKAVSMMNEGDSCHFLVPATGLCGRKLKSARASEKIKWQVKLKNIFRYGNKYRKELEEQAVARYINGSGKSWKAHYSGLFYRIIEPGSGDTIQSGNTVRFSYKGYFLNGVVFDDYAEHNPYFEWVVGTQNQLIRGLEIGLTLLRYGSEAEIILPASLAFGQNGSSTAIVPPGKTILYRLKVLEPPVNPLAKK